MPDLGTPLGSPHIDPHGGLADGGLEVYEGERRLQESLHRFFLGYFSGDPFTLIDPPPGGDAVKTFIKSDLLWGQDRFPDQGENPVIHSVLGDLDERKCREDREYLIFEGEATWNCYVRVSSRIDAEEEIGAGYSHKDADHLCREVSSQLKYLLTGPESRRLSMVGIRHVDIIRGPEPVQAFPQFLRQIVFQHNYRYRVFSPLD